MQCKSVPQEGVYFGNPHLTNVEQKKPHRKKPVLSGFKSVHEHSQNKMVTQLYSELFLYLHIHDGLFNIGYAFCHITRFSGFFSLF